MLGLAGIIIVFSLMALERALIFYLLLNRQISFGGAFKLTSTATALNKLFFSGSGYLASSYFSRGGSLSFAEALSAFLILEGLCVLAWLITGIFWGTQLALRIPAALIFAAAAVLLVFLFRRDKFISAARQLISALKTMGPRVPLVLPLVALDMVLFVGYYRFLLEFFKVCLPVAGIVKIIAVSFTAGYFSPTPAGLGFRDAGLVFMLVKQSIPAVVALSIALADRVITMVFWAGLGLLTGFDVIKEEVRRRFKKPAAKAV